MKRVLVYYAHPGHRTSRVNRPMAEAVQATSDIEFLDLYRAYPRHDINVAVEQERILAADIILFQFPVFWYSTPSIIKDWQDLVLQHGFAYGAGGDRLSGKHMMLAVTAAGPEDAYKANGYQHYPLRTFLTPLEQTARLCRMHFLPPYVMYSSLKAPQTGEVEQHVAGYLRLVQALRDEEYDFAAADEIDVVRHTQLPIRGEG
ncbi:MAG: NAD(P)H-dependent oxidoreductase [Pseudomonadota bacterium]